jgi:acyl-coenzyme A thioesterase PaaI-like protein
MVAHQNYRFVCNERALVLKKSPLEKNAIESGKYKPQYAIDHGGKEMILAFRQQLLYTLRGELLEIRCSVYFWQMDTNERRLHFAHLQRIYEAAPCNNFYPDVQIRLEPGRCILTTPVLTEHFHSGGALHGAVFFKFLDDAAYFACATREPEYFLLTVSYNIKFLRAASFGGMWAEGKWMAERENALVGSSVLYDNNDRVLARGEGIFVRSNLPWDKALGGDYSQPNKPIA